MLSNALRGGLLLLLGALTLAACGDDIQFASPPSAETAAHSADDGHDHAADNADPFADPFADPAEAKQGTGVGTHTEASPGGAAPTDAGTVYFSGRIELAPGFTLPPTYTIYVMAGPPPKGRPPLLSHRYDKPTFPLQFALAHSDIPFKDSKVEGPQVLSVIISERGPVMANEGLYLRCPLETPQNPGSKDIVLTIRN